MSDDRVKEDIAQPHEGNPPEHSAGIPAPDARGPQLHLVLLQPRIPQNTGNIGRLCAVTGARLHLVHPLGFRITDAQLKRAGLDYWQYLDVHHHESWSAFRQSPAAPLRLWLVETRVRRSFWDARFTAGDGLVFGNETEGAPPEIYAELGEEACITIPQVDTRFRSLNLSTAAGIAAYEALRQIGLGGGGA